MSVTRALIPLVTASFLGAADSATAQNVCINHGSNNIVVAGDMDCSNRTRNSSRHQPSLSDPFGGLGVIDSTINDSIDTGLGTGSFDTDLGTGSFDTGFGGLKLE